MELGNGTDRNTVAGNIINSNIAHGLYLNSGQYNEISENMIYSNDIGNTAGFDGIHIVAAATYNSLNTNYCYNNDRYEINILADNTFLEGNHTYGSDHTGEINVDGGVTVGPFGSNWDWTNTKMVRYGAVQYDYATLTDVGPTDNYDVDNINVLLIDTSGNHVTIGGFVNGTAGQTLDIVVVDITNNAVLEHNEGTGNQDIFLHSAGDETLTTEYGGWRLICNGTHWFSSGPH